MRTKNWTLLGGALIAVPAMFGALALVDAVFELGVLHSTWQSAVALYGSVAIGLYLLWRLESRARWPRVVLMLAYAPTMFALIAHLGLFIQFKFDDCMAQQTVPADRREDAAPAEQ